MKKAIVVVVSLGLVILALYFIGMGIVSAPTEPIPETPLLIDTTEPAQLEQQTWKWLETVDSQGGVVTPKVPGAFSLLFEGESVRISTDCNMGTATYTSTDRQLTLGPIGSTKMFCEGAQESEFFEMLRNVASYHINDEGQLILYFAFDEGSMLFE